MAISNGMGCKLLDRTSVVRKREKLRSNRVLPLYNAQTRRDCGALGSKQVVFIKPFPWRHKNICKRGGRKSVRARGGGGHLGSRVFQTQQDRRQVWTHRDCSSTESSQTWMPPLTEKLFAVTNHFQRKNKFSPVEFHGVHQPHLRAGLMPRSSRSAQKKVCGFCLFYVFIWALF